MDKRIDALSFALENEQKEYDFYVANARKTKNMAGKNIFSQIADEEKEHCEILRKLRNRWEKKKKWPATAPLKVKKSLAGGILKTMAGKKSALIAGNESELRAIRAAIDFEARGANLYMKLEKSSSDPKEKAFFNQMASVEHAHWRSLRDAEVFLNDPVTWYQNIENSGSDDL